MVFFWNRRKEQEEREKRVLEAILQEFNAELDREKEVSEKPGEAGPESGEHPDVPEADAGEIPPTVSELVAFLLRKGIIRQDEWERFREETRENASGKPASE